MSEKANWMEPVADHFIGVAKARGLAKDNRDGLDGLLTEMRSVDVQPDGKPKGAKERTGYFWINDKMKTKGRNAFLRLVEERFDSVAATADVDTSAPAPPAPPAPPSEDADSGTPEGGESKSAPPVPPSPGKPRPPVPPAPPSSAPPAPSGASNKAATVVSIKTKSSMEPAVAQVHFQGVLSTEGLPGTVKGAVACQVEDVTWVDLHIEYEGSLAKLYTAIYKDDLVDDAVTKPVDDFGKTSSAYKQR